MRHPAPAQQGQTAPRSQDLRRPPTRCHALSAESEPSGPRRTDKKHDNGPIATAAVDHRVIRQLEPGPSALLAAGRSTHTVPNSREPAAHSPETAESGSDQQESDMNPPIVVGVDGSRCASDWPASTGTRSCQRQRANAVGARSTSTDALSPPSSTTASNRKHSAARGARRGTTSTSSSPVKTACGSTLTGCRRCSADTSRQPDYAPSGCRTSDTPTRRCCKGRGPPEDRLRAARPPLGGVHARHLRPRAARHAG